jgi:hypothetical protein
MRGRPCGFGPGLKKELQANVGIPIERLWQLGAGEVFREGVVHFRRLVGEPEHKIIKNQSGLLGGQFL